MSCDNQQNEDNDDTFDLNSLQNCDMNSNSLRNISSKVKKEGYIKGKGDEESRQMQTGFNEGFLKGFLVGKIAGKFYFTERKMKLQNINNLPQNKSETEVDDVLFSLLFQEIPSSHGLSNSILNEITNFAVERNNSSPNLSEAIVHELTNYVTENLCGSIV